LCYNTLMARFFRFLDWLNFGLKAGRSGWEVPLRFKVARAWHLSK
jgi:hypothetical protein